MCIRDRRRTVNGTLLVAPADVTILLAGGVLVTLLVKDAAAVGTKEYAGESAHFIIAVRAFALLA